MTARPREVSIGGKRMRVGIREEMRMRIGLWVEIIPLINYWN